VATIWTGPAWTSSFQPPFPACSSAHLAAGLLPGCGILGMHGLAPAGPAAHLDISRIALTRRFICCTGRLLLPALLGSHHPDRSTAGRVPHALYVSLVPRHGAWADPRASLPPTVQGPTTSRGRGALPPCSRHVGQSFSDAPAAGDSPDCLRMLGCQLLTAPRACAVVKKHTPAGETWTPHALLRKSASPTS
jgi:hypothetical protein